MTKLPNSDEAYVPSGKLDGYLLSTSHAIGKSKAEFFRAIGYDSADAATLASGLLEIAREGYVRARIETGYGVKYVVCGSLATPAGRRVPLATVWIVEFGLTAPRFVTAYPDDEED